MSSSPVDLFNPMHSRRLFERHENSMFALGRLQEDVAALLHATRLLLAHNPGSSVLQAEEAATRELLLDIARIAMVSYDGVKASRSQGPPLPPLFGWLRPDEHTRRPNGLPDHVGLIYDEMASLDPDARAVGETSMFKTEPLAQLLGLDRLAAGYEGKRPTYDASYLHDVAPAARVLHSASDGLRAEPETETPADDVQLQLQSALAKVFLHNANFIQSRPQRDSRFAPGGVVDARAVRSGHGPATPRGDELTRLSLPVDRRALERAVRIEAGKIVRTFQRRLLHVLGTRLHLVTEFDLPKPAPDQLAQAAVATMFTPVFEAWEREPSDPTRHVEAGTEFYRQLERRVDTLRLRTAGSERRIFQIDAARAFLGDDRELPSAETGATTAVAQRTTVGVESLAPDVIDEPRGATPPAQPDISRSPVDPGTAAGRPSAGEIHRPPGGMAL